MENTDNIKELINEVIKVDNKIYQIESTNKGIPIVGRIPQRAPRQYNGPEPMDLSGTRETKKGACRNCGKSGHYAREYRSRPRE